MKKTREFNIEGKELVVHSNVEERYTEQQIKNIWESLNNQKQNIEVGLKNAEMKLNSMKLPKDFPTSELNKFKKLLEAVQIMNEFDKIKRDMKSMKEQVEDLNKQIEELRPWYEKVIGLTNKDLSIG